MRRPRLAFALFAISAVLAPARTEAQEGSTATPPDTLRALTAVAVEVSYLKFLPPANVFAPYYSWDARLAFDVVTLERRRDAIEFLGVMQTAGTENFGSRIGVGGTGYILRVAVRRQWTPELRLTAGIAHLSSHLTRDLDEKTINERRGGVPIPVVTDPSEYNVLFLEGRRRWLNARLSPELRLGVAPITIRLNGRVRGGHPRPLYASSTWTPWTRGNRTVVVETSHEVGRNSLNRFTLSFATRRPDAAARIDAFASVSLGAGLHVSPDLGAVRDGFALGVRLVVGAEKR